MRLDRDEFIVTFDPAKAGETQLIAKVKESGYTAQGVTHAKDAGAKLTPVVLPDGFALLDAALARARQENKPIALDFFAEWCVPCRRMEKTTLVDPNVAEFLKQVIFVRIDTDANADIAQKLGVVGLPDIRLVAPDGRVLRQLRSFQESDSFAAELRRLISRKQ
jgi:thiol:disulfide interchange protein DsbD